MQASILIVEDERAIADFVQKALRKAGFEAHLARTGTEALDLFDRVRPDLIVLDLALPDMDGLDVCRAVRSRPHYVPIIMLTGRSEDTARIVGLEVGADDYVTKPFAMPELLARVRAVLRLVQSFSDRSHGERLRFRELEIDINGREVLLRGRPVQLTPKEFDLLVLLARFPGRVFEREALLKQVWGYDYLGTSRTVDMHIQRLRRKLEDDPQQPGYILTVRGAGYKFVREESWGR
jgi:DNA-binding response OmpR family regulator